MSVAPGSGSMLSAALALAARDLYVFPCNLDKTPATPHWNKDATADPEQIRRMWTARPNASIGVACGPSRLVVIDIDAGKGGFESWAKLKAEHGIDDETLTSITGGGGWHLFYRAPEGFRGRNSVSKLGPGLDVRADGGYIIAPPSGHPSGGVYTWDPSRPDPIPLPASLRVLLERMERAERPASRPAQPVAATGDLALVRDALRYLDPWAGGYDWWVSILMAVHSKFPGPDGLAVARAWAGGKDGEVEAKWRSFEAGGGVTLGTLYHEAETHGWRPPWRTRDNGTAPTCAPAPDEPPPWLDEDGAPMETPIPPPAQPAAAPAPAPGASARPIPEFYRAALAWEERPKREFIVDGMLWRGDLAMMYGEGGIGKTYTIIDMSVSVATAEPWLGMAVTPCNVLLVDEESGQERMLDRLGRAMRGHGIAPGTDVPIFATSFASWDFRSKAHARRLSDLITATQARLVIIDALVDVMLGGDENAVKDVQPIFHNLRLIAQDTGAAIVLLHHANRSGNQRGSTAIRGAVETVVCLSRQDDAGHVLRLEAEKMRDAAPIKLGLRMAFDKPTESFRLHKAEAISTTEKYSKAEKFVLRYLQDHGATSVKALQENADTCSANSARQAVYSLTERKKIRKVGDTPQGAPASYELADDTPAKL